MTETCSVTFDEGTRCTRMAITRKFGGLCNTCNRWSLTHDGRNPNGRHLRIPKRGRQCSLCTDPLYCADVCVKHYNRYLRHGDPTALTGPPHDVFYVVRGCGMVKLGITSGNPGKRLGAHARENGLTEQLLVLTGLPDGDARWAEVETLSVLASLGAVPVKGREYFSDGWAPAVLDTVGWFL